MKPPCPREPTTHVRSLRRLDEHAPGRALADDQLDVHLRLVARGLCHRRAQELLRLGAQSADLEIFGRAVAGREQVRIVPGVHGLDRGVP